MNWLLWLTLASAHPLAPVGWELDLANEGAESRWRVPAGAGEVQLQPVLPAGCEVSSERVEVVATAVVTTQSWTCVGGLAGREISVVGPDPRPVVLTARGPSGVHRAVLASGRPHVLTERSTLLAFFELGLRHLAVGWDHLALVAGLTVLLGPGRSLLAAVTAFTLGHALTLVLATLQLVRLPVDLVEIAIAATLVALGSEVVRGEPERSSLVVWTGLGIGLVHGLGFAEALRPLALQSEALPVALLGFNLGIELGQLVAVALSLPLALAGARTRRAVGWAIGIAGAAWVWERLGAALSGL